MKKAITVEKTENKITITYFDGEFSEWFIKSERIPMDNGVKDGRLLRNIQRPRHIKENMVEIENQVE